MSYLTLFLSLFSGGKDTLFRYLLLHILQQFRKQESAFLRQKHWVLSCFE